jgi:copper chaperone CopZ
VISTYTLTCDHCAKSIEDALAGVAGVVEAKVSYDEGTARIKTDVRVDSAKLIDTVQGEGFGAEVLDRKGSTVAKGVSDRPRASLVDTPTPSVRPRRRSRGALHVGIIGSGGPRLLVRSARPRKAPSSRSSSAAP